MFRVLGCVFEQHDLRLVVLAAVLCLFASTTAMSMLRRARAAQGRLRPVWLASAGVVAGAGIWGTHFVAMLAYQAGMPVAYDLVLTVTSAAIAVILSGVGFAVAVIKCRPALGGALTGAAIGAMHYVGMAAVSAQAVALWDYSYVVASVLIGIGVTALAMHICANGHGARAHAAGAVLFTLAICAMHFTGMSAVSFRFSPLVAPPSEVVDTGMLAIAVAAVAILIVALGLIGALVDSHLAARAEGESQRLREHIAELEVTKSKLEDTSRQLAAAVDAAAAASKAKSSFLAAMSHELRTPLNAVIGFSELMAMQSFGPLGSDRYRQYAHDIHTSGTHLLALINDILDLSRIDAGDMTLADDLVDLHDIVAVCKRLLSRQAEKAGLTLDSHLEPGLPLVRADARRLKQILINLLSNAIKFTPAGGAVSVRVRRACDDIALVVEDSGIGIDAPDIARALERFGQVDSSLARKYEGVGLGLPIAKQLAELHGGSLTLESELHVGTTVTVTLPAERIVADPSELAA